jgi:hypothetical protein
MTRISSAVRWAGLAAAATALTACSGMREALNDEENAGPCPNAFALHDAARLVEFKQPGVELYENVAYTAEIQAVRTFCRYYRDRPIDAEVELEIGFGKGPAGQDREHVYNVWVAVTRTDVAVLDKATAPIRVQFPRGEDRLYIRREIDNITIPRANKDTSGSNFEILVGFEVTPEQLEFNRLGKRFTVDAAE